MIMTGLAVAVSASAAMAGTKYQANIVPSSATNPPTNPTLSSKGKASLKDDGSIKVGVKGVTDAGGLPAESSTSLKDTGLLDGSEYIYIAKGRFVSLAVNFEAYVPMAVKKGSGKGSVNLAAQFGAIPTGVGRGVEITGGEVWGPLGTATLAACQADVTAGVSIVLPDNNCRGGTQIGVAGIAVP
jgi:hypothetical protein